MKTKLKAFLPILAFLIFSISIIIKLNRSERKSYERFLINELKSLNIKYIEEKGANPKMDKPEMAGIQDYYATIDPNLRNVPHERLISAIKETKGKLKRSKSELFNRYLWNEVPSDMGGRVRSFMFDPNDSDYKKVWAGSVTGGLWYNNNIYNLDSAWYPISDVWENLSISAIVYDPNNPLVYYVGTGEPQTAVTIYRESSTRGVGIWKTIDGGKTWNLLSSTEEFPYITDLIIRDEDGQSVIYAGVVSGTYQGQDHTPVPSDGLFRSTDGGNSWTQVLPNIPGENITYSPSDIELASSDRIFVGTYRNIDGKGGATILYSDNGTDWTIFEDYANLIKESSDPTVVIPGRTIIASSASSPNAIYAVIAAGGYTAQNWIYYRGRFLLKSDDNGETWQTKNLPYGDDGSWATLAWHAITLEVDPNDENTIFAGGLNLHRSTNGGTSWEEISSWFNFGSYYDPNLEPYVHADQHSIIFKPGSSDTICFTNDGGVFLTKNGTETDITFIERNKEFNTLQFYTCNLHPDSATNIFVGGLQDNGTVTYMGNPIDNEESFVSYGDGAYCFFTRNNKLITTVYYNRVYISSSTGLNNYVVYTSNDYSSGTFISPSDYDYENDTYYANAVGFTGNNADNLLRINNVVSSELNNYSFVDVNTGSNVYFSHVRLSKYSDVEERILFLGTQAGELFKVKNIQTNPASTNIGSDNFPLGNISCVTEGKNINELLVTFSNYGVSSVWYTSDGGNSWEEKEGNLPDMPIRWAIFDPEDTSKVVLATEVGIWATNNIHNESVLWEPINNGLPNVRVDMLRLREFDNTILAATHGRGLYYCDLEGGYSTNSRTVIDTELKANIYPNPTSGIVNINFEENNLKSVNISIFNTGGILVESFEKYNNSGELRLNLDYLQNGTYILKISANNKLTTKKILLYK